MKPEKNQEEDAEGGATMPTIMPDIRVSRQAKTRYLGSRIGSLLAMGFFVITCVIVGQSLSSPERTLPRFVTRVDDPRWKNYLQRVYGPDFGLHDGEALDLNEFDFLYVDWMVLSGLQPESFALGDKKCATRSDIFQADLTLRRNLRTTCWNRFDSNGYPHDPCGGTVFSPIPPHTWVEVTHCAVRSWERAYWTYKSRGSGIWLNTGRTIVYRDHDASNGNDTWTEFDSRQYLMPEYRCAPMEIVFSNAHGAETCGGIVGLRQGFRADRPMRCNVSNACLSLPGRV